MKRIAQALIDATQSTLEQWGHKLKEAIQTKEQTVTAYEEKKRLLLPQLLEAHEKGVSTRELQEITGIPHATIARWIRKSKKEETDNVSSN